MGKMISLYPQDPKNGMDWDDLKTLANVANHVESLPLRHKMVFFITLEHVNQINGGLFPYETDEEFIDSLNDLLDLAYIKAKDDELFIPVQVLNDHLWRILDMSATLMTEIMKGYDEKGMDMEDESAENDFALIVSTGLMFHAIHTILSKISFLTEKEAQPLLSIRKGKNGTVTFPKIRKMAVEIQKELENLMDNSIDNILK